MMYDFHTPMLIFQSLVITNRQHYQILKVGFSGWILYFSIRS